MSRRQRGAALDRTCQSPALPRTTAIGAARPFPCVPAKVARLNRQRALALGRGKLVFKPHYGHCRRRLTTAQSGVGSWSLRFGVPEDESEVSYL